MSANIAQAVRNAIRDSVLLKTIQRVRQDGGVAFAVGGQATRTLTPDQIAALEQLGNVADDWSRVRVPDGFDPTRIRQSSFHGDVVLGLFSGHVSVADSVALPTGILRSSVANSIVGTDALIRNVGLLANQVVAPKATIVNCGSVLCGGPTCFGAGRELGIAVETGGREVAVFAEIDVPTAACVARLHDRPDDREAYRSAVDEYVRAAACDRGIVCSGALLRDTPQVMSSFIGPYARIDNATLVSDSTLLSSAEEPILVASGASVVASILQWSCQVTSMAIVDRSVLIEHSQAARHGKVTGCIVGPNTHIAEGEATASLLGPFVEFHHQALLIAVFWPEGKGNVGYGANIGSNHTSKAPDQEFWAGEGLFFGLGVNVKFPADFSRAPYSIIASGVNTLPQRVTFPFCLINAPNRAIPDVSPAYNEIMPGWVLSDNIYTLKRNESKYLARNRARRYRCDVRVFRPDTVDLMIEACRRLEDVEGVQEVYTGQDIPGLGKNYMTEGSRQKAIEAYRFYTGYYALRGLLDRLEQLVNACEPYEEIREVLERATDSEPWEHQRRLLTQELGVTDVAEALERLRSVVDTIAHDVEESKAKDDRRGARIIDDYAHAHPPASEDPYVRRAWEETQQLHEQIDRMQKAWNAGS